MELTIQDITDTRKKLTISVSADEYAEEDKKVFADVSKHGQVPGFRPGKSPAHLLRKRFAKTLREEVRKALLRKAYDAAREQSGFSIYAEIDFEENGLGESEGGEVVLTVDIVPEFSLPDYKGISVEAPVVTVSPEDIESTIRSMREQRAEFEEVDRPAEKGDYAKVSYEGKIDGQLIKELDPEAAIWGTQENTWEQVAQDAKDAGGEVRAVVEGILGMAPGDTKEATMVIPDTVEFEALKGKEAVYAMTLHEVRERKLAEINEEFLKAHEVESLEALEKKIEEQMRDYKERQRDQEIEKQLLNTLLSRIEFAIPESGVETEAEKIFRDVVISNLRQGVPQEQLESGREEIFEKSKGAAVTVVKRDILLSKIAEAEEIKVANEDLQRAIYMEAMQSRTKPDKLVKEMRKDSGRLEQMQRDILMGKTMAFLAENAVITDVEPAAAPDQGDGHVHDENCDHDH